VTNSLDTHPVPGLHVIDLGRLGYSEAYDVQLEHHAAVLASRDSRDQRPREIGRILIVEHPAVITVTRRPGALSHVLAAPDTLTAAGVEVIETDRGGDVTYHGPGQLVVYPVLDLNTLKFGLHDYMRMLESVVIESLTQYAIVGTREAGATGVWVNAEGSREPQPAKIAAMGVRVRRWISMHGLSLNVSCDLAKFSLIVPCGLAGRAVTSIEQVLHARGKPCPTMTDVAGTVTQTLVAHIASRLSSLSEP
jgi:lipoyl(octanoyl) transferase